MKQTRNNHYKINYNQLFIGLIVFTFLFSCNQQELKEIDLAGTWQFQMDPEDKGIAEAWYSQDFSDTIKLPGSMAENGKGYDISLETHWTGNLWNDSLWYKSEKMAKYREPGNIKVSFWLSPEKVYYGPAWYQKKVNIPEGWNKNNIELYLERTHWETTLWVDDQKVAMKNTLATPHHYDLKDYLTPGEHTLTLRVDNRIKDINPGLDAHSVSDNTQTNWNGVIGDIKLKSRPMVSLDAIQLYPDVANNKVLVKGMIKNASGNPQSCMLSLMASGNEGEGFEQKTQEMTVETEKQFEIEYPMGDNPLLWDEFNPNLYEMTVQVESSEGTDEEEVVFGMRNFEVDGKHFSINGRPVFLRGTLECAIFPLTGYPPTEVSDWKRIFKTIQEHGLNHMRFHSWCPPKAAFEAADEMGVYLQVEASAWATIGDGKPIDQWIYKEAESIIETYGNHPSFVMMAYGNEPHGPNYVDYLIKFIDHMKQLDTRRVYTGGAGWPYLGNADFFNNSGPRIQGWNANLNSIINAKPPQTVFDYNEMIQKTAMPFVSHEMGQWCVYPNFKEMSKYTGVLKPKNFEIFKETLEENHLGALADSFLLASGNLQRICYKADIEAALRTKDMAGFQLLDLHDFPGQGTALVGVLDAFWEEKGYVSPEEFSTFCSPTVPLARLEKRVFSNTETLEATVEVAHYGATPIQKAASKWTLNTTDGSIFAEGSFPLKDLFIGNGQSMGTIAVPLENIQEAQKLVLSVTVNKHINQWPIWVYPSQQEPIDKEDEVIVIDKLDATTVGYLKNGGKVLLNITKGDIAPNRGGDIGVGFSSIFWNTAWTNGQKPHTLGILCNPQHPALAHFPTEYHSNWQWWDAMTHSNAIVLDAFSPNLKPIVRIVDDWFENRRTALIFEVRIGEGKLLVSGIDLHTNLEKRLEAQQLLYSLKKYMVSDDFNPKVEVEMEVVGQLFSYEL
ncbi:MAG: sugar-binding domain-containing protein [Bacteroidota bacterium]